MSFKKFYLEMNNQIKNKELFETAKKYAYEYMDNVNCMDVTPSKESLALLDYLSESMPEQPSSPQEILNLLHMIGSKNTVAQTGGKYFSFVHGGVTPVGIAARWLSDTWDQSSAMFVASPIAAKLEDLCEKWLVEMLGLPENTAVGLVAGSSMGTVCGLVTGRNQLLLRQGWDVSEKGLFDAPKIKVLVGNQAHTSVWKALSLLGFGKENIELIPVDCQGRVRASKLPLIDDKTLLILQAGNVNGGAFDEIDKICDIANKAQAWIHIDGAFGLWAAACENTKYLTRGIEKADSWSADAHKTLNVPYDSGVVLCKNRSALINAMQATASYLQFSENRDNMLYSFDMSRRSRSVELWATLKYFGKSGINELINHLCVMTKYFAGALKEIGFVIENEVVFNQIIMRCQNDYETTEIFRKIQSSNKMCCGQAIWNDKIVIRIRVCSWQTTKKEIDECLDLISSL